MLSRNLCLKKIVSRLKAYFKTVIFTAILTLALIFALTLTTQLYPLPSVSNYPFHFH